MAWIRSNVLSIASQVHLLVSDPTVSSEGVDHREVFQLRGIQNKLFKITAINFIKRAKPSFINVVAETKVTLKKKLLYNH